MKTAAARVTELMGFPSQAQLAKAIGVDRAVITRWKSKIPDAQKVKLIRLARSRGEAITLRHIEACESNEA